MNPFLAALEILALLAGSVACLAALAAVSGSPLIKRRHPEQHPTPDRKGEQQSDDADPTTVPQVRSAG
jgi:hypothetical protein